MEKKTMICGFCGGEAELKFSDIKLFGGKIILREQPFFKCKKCKREFTTSDQMRETEKQLNVFSMTRPFVSTGGSLAITIPPDLAKFYNIKKGTKAQLIPESRCMLKVRMNC